MQTMLTPKNVRALAFTVAVVAASLLIGPLLASFTSPQIPDTIVETPTWERTTASRSTTRTPSIGQDAGVPETVTPTTTGQPPSLRSPTAVTTAPMPLSTPTALSATTTNAPATATPPSDEQVYVVTPGDNLITISQQFGVSIDAIRRRNELTSDILRVGQELIIPGPGSDGTAVADDGEQVYVVQSGDVLMAIAERFGVTVEAVRERNGLTGNALQVGQELLIPVAPTP